MRSGAVGRECGQAEAETPESGTLWARGQHSCMQPHVAGGRGGVMSGELRRRQIFTTSIRAGKLKNWKSEKLTSRPATRPTRIPDFQDFRFSPAFAAHEILPNEPGRGWVRGMS